MNVYWLIGVLAAAILLPVIGVYAEEFYVFTDRGNKFKIVDEREEDDGGGFDGCQSGNVQANDTSGNPLFDSSGKKVCIPDPSVYSDDDDKALEAIVSSIHTNSRLVDEERSGKMSYADAGNSFEATMFPYMGFGNNTKYVAAIYDDIVPQVISIPSPYHDYTFTVSEDHHEQSVLELDLKNRITTINAQDIAKTSYYLEEHAIRGEGIVIVKLPAEAERARLTHNLADNAEVRLMRLSDSLKNTYDFSEVYGNRYSKTISVDIPIITSGYSYMTIDDRNNNIPSHHKNNTVFTYTATMSGTIDLDLCTTDGTPYGHVRETVEKSGPWYIEGDIGSFKVWPALNVETESKRKVIEQEIKNELKRPGNAETMYAGDRGSIDLFPDSDLGYTGDLTYCKGHHTYTLHHDVTFSTPILAITYTIIPMVLDADGLPVATLDEVFDGFQLISSGTVLSGITSNTYLIIDPGDGNSQIRIRYNERAGQVEQTSADNERVYDIEYRNIDSGVSVTSLGDGLNITGDGRTIVRVNNPGSDPKEVIFTIQSQNSTIRLVESKYNLLDLFYKINKGFLINYCECNPGTNTLSVFAGSVDDSKKSAIYEYSRHLSMVVYHGRCCYGKYTVDVSDNQEVNVNASSLNTRPHDSGYKEIIGDLIDPVKLNDRDERPPGAKLFGDKQPRWYSNYVDNHEHSIYDTLPVKEIRDLSADGTTTITIEPNGHVYLVVDSTTGSTVITTAEKLETRSDLFIDGLTDEKIPYYLEQGGITVASGIVEYGKIEVPIEYFRNIVSDNILLHLYHDALVEQLDGTENVNNRLVFFDGKNNIIKTNDNSKDSFIYNPHKYIKLPQFTTPVSITDMNLTSTVDEFGDFHVMKMNHLVDDYGIFSDIFIPVIPGYQEVHMMVKNTEPQDAEARKVIMKIIDVAPITNIKTIAAKTNTENEIAEKYSTVLNSVVTSASFVATESGENFVNVDLQLDGSGHFMINHETEIVERFKSREIYNAHGFRGPGLLHNTFQTVATHPNQLKADQEEKFSEDFVNALKNGQISNIDFRSNIFVNGELQSQSKLLDSIQPDTVIDKTDNIAKVKFSPNTREFLLVVHAEPGDFVEIIFTASMEITSYSQHLSDTSTGERTYYGWNTWYGSCDSCRGAVIHTVATSIYSSFNDAVLAESTINLGPGTITITS